MSAFIQLHLQTSNNIQASSVCQLSCAKPVHYFHFARSGLEMLKRCLLGTSVTSICWDILLLHFFYYLHIILNPSLTWLDKCVTLWVLISLCYREDQWQPCKKSKDLLPHGSFENVKCLTNMVSGSLHFRLKLLPNYALCCILNATGNYCSNNNKSSHHTFPVPKEMY